MQTQQFEQLAGTNVLSISIDQAHRFFEMLVVTTEGTRFRLTAWNLDAMPLSLALGALHIRSTLTNAENLPILGELEGIGVVDEALVLEGDFGDISIRATNVSVELIE